MPHWLMKLEVEGHLGIEDALPRLTFKHPRGQYEVHLENSDMRPGCEVPLLNAYLTFDADSLEGAEVAGQALIQRFLEFLAFSTGSRFRVRRPLCLLDWSTGIVERQGYVYRSFSNPDVPQRVLNGLLASTLELLLWSDADADLMSALHWFAAAVSAKPPDQQFQLFWFAIETLARHSRSKDKVPDRCGICREPLYCRKCEEVTTHRPYPSQAIEQLFHRFISDEPGRACKLASSTRHALLHAEDLSEVERRNETTLAQLVDLVGGLAWVALLDALVRHAPSEGPKRIDLIQPNTFLHHRVAFKVQVSCPTRPDREPLFTDLPQFELNLIVKERATETSDA